MSEEACIFCFFGVPLLFTIFLWMCWSMGFLGAVLFFVILIVFFGYAMEEAKRKEKEEKERKARERWAWLTSCERRS